MAFIFYNYYIYIYGMSSFPLTNSIIFQRGWNHQPAKVFLRYLRYLRRYLRKVRLRYLEWGSNFFNLTRWSGLSEHIHRKHLKTMGCSHEIDGGVPFSMSLTTQWIMGWMCISQLDPWFLSTINNWRYPIYHWGIIIKFILYTFVYYDLWLFIHIKMELPPK